MHAPVGLVAMTAMLLMGVLHMGPASDAGARPGDLAEQLQQQQQGGIGSGQVGVAWSGMVGKGQPGQWVDMRTGDRNQGPSAAGVNTQGTGLSNMPPTRDAPPPSPPDAYAVLKFPMPDPQWVYAGVPAGVPAPPQWALSLAAPGDTLRKGEVGEAGAPAAVVASCAGGRHMVRFCRGWQCVGSVEKRWLPCRHTCTVCTHVLLTH